MLLALFGMISKWKMKGRNEKQNACKSENGLVVMSQFKGGEMDGSVVLIDNLIKFLLLRRSGTLNP